MSASADHLTAGNDDRKVKTQSNSETFYAQPSKKDQKITAVSTATTGGGGGPSTFVDNFRSADDRTLSTTALKSVAVRSASLNVITQTDNVAESNPNLKIFDVTTKEPLSAPKRHSADPDPTLHAATSIEDDYEFVSKESSPCYPDNLIVQTEKLTAVIQNLLADAQAGQQKKFRSHAAKVQSIVDGMVNGVPLEFRRDKIENNLDTMVDACIRLTVHCSSSSTTPREDNFEQISCQVVQAAYEVAKAAKALMILIQR